MGKYSETALIPGFYRIPATGLKKIMTFFYQDRQEMARILLNNFTYISCMNEYLNDIGEKGRQIRLSGRFQGRFMHSAGERMTVMGKIRAILIGCGVVGSGIIMETYRRGVEYQGIFDVREEIIGKVPLPEGIR